MALDFPASPATNQTYSGPGGVVWVWDGAKWVSGTGSTVYAPVTSPVFLGNPTAPNPPAGDADTSVATTSFVAAAVATALHDTGRNLIHNPLFQVAQRGAGAFTASGYTLDRWYHLSATDAFSVGTAGITDAIRAAIGDEEARIAYANTFTGNAAAGAFNMMIQRIENVRRLANKTVTISFWAACGAGALKLGVSIDQVFGTGGSPSAYVPGNGTAVTLSTTFARYSVTFNVPSISGKTLGTNGDDYTGANIWFSSGATNATRAGSIGVQSGAISLWGVQLEIGSVATPLEKPDPRYDLANCQRFYCTTDVHGLTLAAGVNSFVVASANWPVPMRATPTTITSVVLAADLNMGSLNIDIQSQRGCRCWAFTSAAGQANFDRMMQASADL